MGYDTNEKQSAVTTIIYTDFSDDIVINTDNNVITIDVVDDKPTRRTLDNILDRVYEIDQEQKSIDIIYQYTKDEPVPDDGLRIKVVENCEEYDNTEWYYAKDLY